jgi:hypothetical protein
MFVMVSLLLDLPHFHPHRSGPQFLDDMESFNEGTYPGTIPPVSVILYLAREVKHCIDVTKMLAFLRERTVCDCLD